MKKQRLNERPAQGKRRKPGEVYDIVPDAFYTLPKRVKKPTKIDLENAALRQAAIDRFIEAAIARDFANREFLKALREMCRFRGPAPRKD